MNLTGRGLTWAEVPALCISSSLSDSSSLLLSESSSGFPKGPAFPGAAGVAPFPGVPLAGLGATLIGTVFSKAFTW